MNCLHTSRRAAWLLARCGLVVVGGLAVFGCGSKPAATSTTTTSTVPSTTLAPASTTSTVPGTPPTCSTGVLSAAASTGGSAAGSAYETVTLTNGGPTTCAVDGYPTIAFFAPSAAGGAGAGAKLDIAVQDGGGPAPTLVTLAAKGQAEFLVLFSDVPAGGVGCSTVASAEMSLPGSSESLTFPMSISLCGGSVRLYPFGAPGSENP